MHSQVLPNGIIQLIECANQEKSMKIKTWSQFISEWNAIILIKKGEIIDLNEKGER